MIRINVTIIAAVVLALAVSLITYFKYEDSNDMLKKAGTPILGFLGVLFLVGMIGTSLGAGMFPGMGGVPSLREGDQQDIEVTTPQDESYWGLTVMDGLREDTEISSVDTVKIAGTAPEMDATFSPRDVVDNYDSGSSEVTGASPGKTLYALAKEDGYYSNYSDLRTGADKYDFTMPTVELNEIGTTSLSLTNVSDSDDINLSGNTVEIDHEAEEITFTLEIGLEDPYTAIKDIYFEGARGANWDNIGLLSQSVSLAEGVETEATTGDFNLADDDEGEIRTDGVYSWPDTVDINIKMTGMDNVTSGEIYTITGDDLDGDYGYDMETGMDDFELSFEFAEL